MTGLVFSGLLLAHASTFAQLRLSGRVLDREGEVVPFVRIGIVETKVALMSEFDGTFSLSIPEEFRTRSLTFQVPGFRTTSFNIDSLSRLNSMEIRLEEDITVLRGVVVTNKRLKTKVIGNNGNRKSSDIDNDIQGDINMAYATLVKGKKQPYRIKKIAVYLRNPYPEKYYVRPLVMQYDEEKRRLGSSLIPNNVFFEVGEVNGWFEMEIEDLDITTEGDVVIGVEYLGSTREQAYFSISFNFSGGVNFKRTNTSDGFDAISSHSWYPYEAHRRRPLIRAEIEY